MTGGGTIFTILLRWADRAVTLTPAVLVTEKLLVAHGLPPLPEEPEASRERSSQRPSTVGALMITFGATEKAGAAILRGNLSTVRQLE
jgi:hypothetical protein